MNLELREQLKEKAYDECRNNAPTPSVDHSSHYKPSADNTGRKTLAEYTELTRKAFNIQEKE